MLQLSDSLSGLPLAAFGIGVGIGSILAGKLSHSKVEVGHIPLGAIGLTFGLFVMGSLSPDLTGTLTGMAWLGCRVDLLWFPLMP